MHVTFRETYAGKNSDMRHQKNAKKTAAELYEDAVAPALEALAGNFRNQDPSKPLIRLTRTNSANVKIECNFDKRD